MLLVTEFNEKDFNNWYNWECGDSIPALIIDSHDQPLLEGAKVWDHHG